MNILEIFDNINKADPEFQDRISPRRAAIKNMTGFGAKVAAAALPLAFSGLLKKAYGQTTSTNVVDVLNFALTDELLESSFYNKAISTTGLIPSADLPGLQLITNDENHHRDLLISAIKSLGGTPVSSLTFDYTGGKGSGNGPFADVFTNYQTFLAVAQAFEDTGVRAYKGQATNLMSNPAILQTALNIHSVEARHASHLRILRNLRFNVAIKPWITGTTSGISSPAVMPSYAGEDNTTQAGVNIASIVSTNAATEAFDEPLDKATVLSVLSNFIKA